MFAIFAFLRGILINYMSASVKNIVPTSRNVGTCVFNRFIQQISNAPRDILALLIYDERSLETGETDNRKNGNWCYRMTIVNELLIKNCKSNFVLLVIQQFRIKQ